MSVLIDCARACRKDEGDDAQSHRSLPEVREGSHRDLRHDVPAAAPGRLTVAREVAGDREDGDEEDDDEERCNVTSVVDVEIRAAVKRGADAVVREHPRHRRERLEEDAAPREERGGDGAPDRRGDVAGWPSRGPGRRRADGPARSLAVPRARDTPAPRVRVRARECRSGRVTQREAQYWDTARRGDKSPADPFTRREERNGPRGTTLGPIPLQLGCSHARLDLPSPPLSQFGGISRAEHRGVGYGRGYELRQRRSRCRPGSAGHLVHRA